MSGDKNFIDYCRRVLVNAEWVEGGCWIGIKQCGAQCIGVHDSAQALSAIIYVIAEPAFPLPSPEVIAELTEITSQADGKLKIVGGNLVGNQPCFQTSVMYAGSESGTRRRSASFSVRTFWVEASRRGIIWDCEWIERVLDRHANAFAAYSEWMGRVREHIRGK